MFRGYLIRRIATSLIIFLVILNFQFVLFWVINPVEPVKWVISPGFSVELVERLRKLYGLDLPLHVQYTRYMTNMLTLNFGWSFRTHRPVIDSIIEYLPYTLALVLTAAIITICVGTILGLYAAAKRGRIADFSITGLGLLMFGLPSFLILLAFRYVFAEKLGLFPIIGTIIHPPGNPIAYFGEFMYRMALPLITLIVMGFGSRAFFTRNIALDVLTQDFIQTARAKGIGEKKVLFGHVFPTILPPIITGILMGLPGIIFGSIVTEYIFTWKGMGWWFLDSIWGGDYPAVQAVFFIYTVMLLMGNLLADISYGFVDPRIRVGVRR